MLILDTDHLVEYQKGTSAESQRLKERLTQQSQPFGITIISVEEEAETGRPVAVKVMRPALAAHRDACLS